MHQGNVTEQSAVGAILAIIGDTYLSQGNSAAAIDAYQKALAVNQKLVDADAAIPISCAIFY